MGEPKVDVRAMTKDRQHGNRGGIPPGLKPVRTRIIIETELARMADGIGSTTSVPVILGSVRD
ncbi:hypothetical protein AYJ54_36345 [Bradyrhizobium centrolobii]|uniref:Uncharacterized protein n=2 Tax=Bradyrhizobium centrolobii TaxID=1505087 RepID=A0A176Y608_9BRAD|nr:hypothetical protein AYJ54_36345 [Bradyrhizobium centrolobii]